jgi:hypothetical protein
MVQYSRSSSFGSLVSCTSSWHSLPPFTCWRASTIPVASSSSSSRSFQPSASTAGSQESRTVPLVSRNPVGKPVETPPHGVVSTSVSRNETLVLSFRAFPVLCYHASELTLDFAVLQTSIDVSKKVGHVYLVSFIGGLLATAFGAWFSVTLVSVYVKYEPGNNPACREGAGGCSSAKVIGLVTKFRATSLS